ncbi:oxidoreductase [Planctobacterium marinum]|uniref:oxidoreductase n=1 Tax=Planctobacterium marinum TaxID=1631968 RepID=UPI001E454131|nr:oxidoreductase [Planctobacterium marinum]MCC2605769.1 oxidoreductase [Planctobacterium marinum]
MIKVALIGFGSVAQNLHLPLIRHQSQLQITAVASSKPELVANLVPEARCYANYQQLLADSDADLVVITTPNEFHYPIAMQALKASRHVVIEKPVALLQKEVQAMQHEAEEHDVRLFPFHNRRWDGDFQTVAHLIKEDRLGKVKLFESHFDRFRPEPTDKWKEKAGPGNGIWYDLGPHLLDQTFLLFGIPEAITARLLATRPNSNTTDYFHVQLHYKDKEVHLRASNHNAAPVQRFHVQGNKGTLVKYEMDVQENQLKAGLAITDDSYGIDDEANYGVLYEESDQGLICSQRIATLPGAYPQFYQQVVDSIRYDATPPVSVDAAIEVARFLQLGMLSQEQGKTIKVRQFREE